MEQISDDAAVRPFLFDDSKLVGKWVFIDPKTKNIIVVRKKGQLNKNKALGKGEVVMFCFKPEVSLIFAAA